MNGLTWAGMLLVIALAFVAVYSARAWDRRQESRRPVVRGYRARGWRDRWTTDDIDRMWSR
jgi:hypothetical protein